MKKVIMVLILVVCFSGNAFGEDSVFHYVKPDWWGDSLWPNGLKFRYAGSYYAIAIASGVELNLEVITVFHDVESGVTDDTLHRTARSQAEENPSIPVTFTFPESVLGRLGTLMFYGQAFFNYSPPWEMSSRFHIAGDPGSISWEEYKEALKTFLTDEEVASCGAWGYSCDIGFDLFVYDFLVAGYTLGFSIFTSEAGSSRFLKFGLGAGISYNDTSLYVYLCPGSESYGSGDDWRCENKTTIDKATYEQFGFAIVSNFTTYEYKGETLGLMLISWEGGTFLKETNFSSHPNLDTLFRIAVIEIISISVFF